MFSITSYENPVAAIVKLLRSLSVQADPVKIGSELDKHPDYSSLLAISDILNAMSIENAAYRVDNDNLLNVPQPFIAHTNLNGGDFLVVNKLDNENVIVSSEKWNEHKLSLQEFKKIFNGTVLTAEPSAEFTAKSTIGTSLASLKGPAIITGLALILIAALFSSGYFTSLTWQTLVLSIFKSAGLVTSILLLIQSIDTNNPLVQKLCQGGTKTNCNAILSSKAAKVFEGLSWSEVGFFYFAGTWLLLLFGGSSATVWLVLAILNIISLPYTFYSIYYQARVAKQWCIMCCTVQGLLWLEFIIIAAQFHHVLLFGFDINALPGILICLLSPVILWMLVKPLFTKLQQVKPLKQQLRKFKYNADLFNQLLTAQPKYAVPDTDWSIVLGDADAEHIVTMVSNPYCQPCARGHELLSELLAENGNVQARVVFTANNTDEDIKTPVSRHLMALNELPDKSIVKQALHDWYEQKQKSYEAWAKVYPVKLDEANFYKLEKQHDWCKMAEITATPTMLVDGYRLPDLYQLPDLKYMLE